METEHIQFSQRKVTTVAPRDTTEIQLRLLDWRRIYRRINGISTTASCRELLAGVCWGITGSALLSLIPLYQSTQAVDPWVKPTFWIVAASSGIIGIIIWNNVKESNKDVKSIKSELIIDMKAIHTLYFPGEDLDK